MNKKLEKIDSLLFDWEAGLLDDAGVTELRNLLRSDEEARTHFVKTQMITAAMQLEGEAGLKASLPTEAESNTQGIKTPDTKQAELKPAPSGKRRGTPIWLTAALALLVTFLGGWLAFLHFGSKAVGPLDSLTDITQKDLTDLTPQEATSSGIALVTRLVDVRWANDQRELEVGEALPPGRLAIESGYAQVEFFSGATVIIEGPAELELRSATLARVRSGRLRAQVPPAARGFSLEVDDLTVVDLGTEFALSVSEDGANVQVFDGEVELHEANQNKKLVTAGQAVTRTERGLYEQTEVTPDGFEDIAGLAARAAGQQSDRFDRWQAWSKKLRSDKRLITYYGFDHQGSWERRLHCDAMPANSELDGAIVGAKRLPGRWTNKGALEFKQPADRVRVQIPGEFESLTFACWVKIDSLDRLYNSLFLTDHYNQGEPHWQILNTGQLFFSVRSKPDDEKHGVSHKVVLSPPFWKPSLSGKWLHLATSYDVQNRRTSHYLNGKLLHSEEIPTPQAVRQTRIGAASIGNWSAPTKPDADFAIRNLNGSIDELAIFAAALSAAEIKEMYEHGKP